MKNVNKIGLSALAGSLVALSVQAGEVSVSGASSLYIANSNENSKTGYSMDDSVTFSGSSELDNGMTYSFSIELDGDSTSSKQTTVATTATNNVLDDHSISLSGDFGTIKFAGHGGAGVLDSWDDKTPNAYEESWDVVKNADKQRVNGIAPDNQFMYTSPTFSGATLYASYANPASGNASTYQDYGILLKPEAVEGLELAYAFGTTEATAGSERDEQTMYIKYTYGPVTAGYQVSEVDAPAAADDDENTMWGISYAITDSFTVAYNQHTFDLGTATVDQEGTGISASYTMGGITVAGAMNSVDNVQASTATTADIDAYEMSISFAF